MSSRGWLRNLLRPTPAAQARPTVRPCFEGLEARDVPTLLGNSLFPADSPWNQKVNNAPVAANSATLVSSIGAGSRLKADFGSGLYEGGLIGIPYNVVSGNQPRVEVVIDAYANESDIIPVPIPAGAVIEGDPLPSGQNTGDRHLIVYDRDNNIVYELFNVKKPSETGDGKWHASSEAVWDLKQNSFRTPGWTSADAAGLPILPGLVLGDEVFDNGVINHALRFTVPSSRNAYVYPASHQAGSNNAALPRMGERFRLKQSFDISGFSAANRVILQALKDYGMIVADNGSSWFVSGAPDPRWINDDLQNLRSIFGSSFEAVDLRPRVVGLSAAGGPAGSQLTVSGLNFSGGAGQTKVFFGTTQATGLAIQSDSSLVVTVPPGVNGTTVDVTVVSPYGTSPLVVGDRFTYSGTPLPPPPPPPPPPPAAPAVMEFASASYLLRESGRFAVITVARGGNVNVPAAVSYVSANGTAAAGSDYAATSGRLDFAEGESVKTFVVPVFEDKRREANETVTLLLGSPSAGAALGSQSTAVLMIVDNDSGRRGKFVFSAPAYSASEGGTVTLTVTRLGGLDGAVSVGFATSNRTALAGQDYVARSGRLQFADGQATRTITLATRADLRAEPLENFFVTLSNPLGGASLGGRRGARVSVLDAAMAAALAGL